MKHINPLIESEIDQLRPLKGNRAVRFLADGHNVSITTGRILEKGINIIFQFVYHDRSTEFARAAITFLSLRNPGIKFRATYH